MSLPSDVRAIVDYINTVRAAHRAAMRTRNVNDTPLTYERKTFPVLYMFDKPKGPSFNNITIVRRVSRAHMKRVCKPA